MSIEPAVKSIMAIVAIIGSLVSIALGDDADKRPSIGTWVVMRDVANYPACHSLDDLIRYYELWQTDETDYHKAARTFLAGHCTYIKAETEVFIEDARTSDGAFCVRPRGETDCMWVSDLTVNSKETGAANKAATKDIIDKFNDAFDSAHPECRGWRVKKDLPNYCY
jgi:hypothetical protein